MFEAYTGTAIRAAERPLIDAGQGAALMLRAAHGLSLAIVRRLRDGRASPGRRGGRVYGSRVALLVGSGNNGGDALFAGAQLCRRGVRTTALLTSERTHAEALQAFLAAGGRVVRWPEEARAVAEARSAQIVVDGILGTGARGGLHGSQARLVEALQGHPGVVAADLPSGIDADTGTADGPVLRAAETVTFGGLKSGLLLPPAEEYAGALSLVDLGIDLPEPALWRLTAQDLADAWPRPSAIDHKYSRGVLGVIAGSAHYPGAAVLAVKGALAAGVGMVRFLGPTLALPANFPPEAVAGHSETSGNRVQAWLIGPGIANDAAQEARCREALASGLPTVADAGALALLPERMGPQVVLTPHAGELATLLSGRGHPTERAEVEREPLFYARRASELTGATVLLKGSTTVIVSPGGVTFSQTEGTPWLATAGSGDTLAGILGALLAGGMKPALAAAMAASVHGRAGVLASGGFPGGPIRASEIAQAVPQVLRELFAGSA
ncbi:NAD(P)H-hydrate dehydratase [Psychromicrobium xiongbiense]|uniref:NAD(P)H-hydrate dehydratase n=1 Tax=Psychromicrobium xiongbiense TaxID=3051184 RepID=UPI002553034A|nr:NAD(P)H-hydrate dehydratase [Psychromicrobium sp. YIM S02556]